jgi:hypothetical protein
VAEGCAIISPRRAAPCHKPTMEAEYRIVPCWHKYWIEARARDGSYRRWEVLDSEDAAVECLRVLRHQAGTCRAPSHRCAANGDTAGSFLPGEVLSGAKGYRARGKRLFAMSRNRCAFPNCQQPLVDQGGKVTGRICHIRAGQPGGPRYDAAQLTTSATGSTTSS